MAVKAITFDFWCTLFRDANSEPRQRFRINAFKEATGMPEDRIAAVLKEVWAEFARTHIEEQYTLTPEDAVEMAAERCAIALEPATAAELASVFAKAILAYPAEPIEDALEAVRAATRHVPIGLISDTGVSPGSSIRQLMDRNGFSGWFGVLTFSDEVGVAKPQPRMFRRTARRLNVKPSELLHIGDLESTDIAGAKGVGAKAALFTGDKGGAPNTTQADYTFATWRQFIDALPELLSLQEDAAQTS